MTDVRASIAAALERRGAQQAFIDRVYHDWRELEKCVGALQEVITEAGGGFAALRQRMPDGPLAAVTLDGDWYANEIRALQADIERHSPGIAAIRARFHRKTVNIGVVGRPRAGKSTLLRTITALGEETIPSGRFDPTTAARSRIMHCAGRADAQITLRTWEEFRDGYLAPLHRDAGCPPPIPFTPDDFLRYPYQRLLADARGRGDDDAAIDQQKYLKRLWTAQYSLNSYGSLLTGHQRTLDIARLTDLRPFVAYPEGDSHLRPYHAVRDVWIYCEFRVTDVENLVLVDLPGSGEAALDVESQFIEDLRNEVDVLLQVKRPSENEAFIGDEDWKVLTLADTARMGVERSHFISFVVNSDPEHVATAAMENAERRAREEITGPNRLRLLVGDVSDPADVRDKILGPVLEGLAHDLAAMDRKAAATQIGTAAALAERVLALVDGLAAQASRLGRLIPDEEQALSRAAKRLRGAVGRQLDELSREYDRRARDREPIPELEDNIAKAGAALTGWADTGFGSGSRQRWLTLVDEGMTVDPGETRDDQCTLARQRIRAEFGKVDSSLAGAIERLHQAVADVLRQRLTAQLVPESGQPLETLLETTRQLRLATLSDALEELLGIQSSYGNIFLRVGGPIVHQIRPVARGVTVDQAAFPPAPAPPVQGQGLGLGHGQGHGQPGGGPGESLYSRARKVAGVVGSMQGAAIATVAAANPAAAAAGVLAAEAAVTLAPVIAGWIWRSQYSDDSAAGLHDALSRAAKDAVWQIEGRMREEAGQLTEVLAAAMSQFFDAFARTPEVEDEWTRLCAPVRPALWPDTFGEGRTELTACLARLTAAAASSGAAARAFMTAAGSGGPAELSADHSADHSLAPASG